MALEGITLRHDYKEGSKERRTFVIPTSADGIRNLLIADGLIMGDPPIEFWDAKVSSGNETHKQRITVYRYLPGNDGMILELMERAIASGVMKNAFPALTIFGGKIEYLSPHDSDKW